MPCKCPPAQRRNVKNPWGPEGWVCETCRIHRRGNATTCFQCQVTICGKCVQVPQRDEEQHREKMPQPKFKLDFTKLKETPEARVKVETERCPTSITARLSREQEFEALAFGNVQYDKPQTARSTKVPLSARLPRPVSTTPRFPTPPTEYQQMQNISHFPTPRPPVENQQMQSISHFPTPRPPVENVAPPQEVENYQESYDAGYYHEVQVDHSEYTQECEWYKSRCTQLEAELKEATVIQNCLAQFVDVLEGTDGAISEEEHTHQKATCEEAWKKLLQVRNISGVHYFGDNNAHILHLMVTIAKYKIGVERQKRTLTEKELQEVQLELHSALQCMRRISRENSA
mmetsp:Transcript_7311/g.11540  ORF Transcript_7311/g.11540 Transcript_7311/m.11540 type:complete len:344 (-) Transcript_7311:1082-2113(-)